MERRETFKFLLRRSFVLPLAATLLLMTFTGALAFHIGTFELDENAVTSATDDWDEVFAGTSSALATEFVADGDDFSGGVTVPAGLPSDDTTYFTTGGSKDVHDINQWMHQTGDVAPDKDEILNAYAAAYTVGGDQILYFGMDRFANNGDAQVGFWFFQNPVGLNPDGTFSGVHTIGDILILSHFTQGGVVDTIEAYEWVGPPDPDNLALVATGADCAAGTAHADGLCATVNDNTETAPWPYVAKSPKNSPDFPSGSFYEGGFNATQFGLAGCLSGFLAETRSSTSLDAQLKDFALGELNTCGDIQAHKYHDVNGDGDDDSEPDLSGWTIFIDGNGNETLDGGEDSGVTDGNGDVFFNNLTNGTYSVCEVLQGGWLNTDPDSGTLCENVVVSAGVVSYVDFGNFQPVDVEACKFKDLDGDGGADAPIAGWTVHLTVGGVVQDTQVTGENGCYKWTDLGPQPGSYYDVSETVPAGWTPTSDTSHNFESPPQSGASYTFTFTNFENVDVEACKYEDFDGDGGADAPIIGWTVHLTVGGVVVDTQVTGENGCYKWTDLGPQPGSYYDVSETVPAGWTPTSDTSHNFESPPQSGASYTFTFTNFENVDVTACKVKDADGDPATTDDQSPIAGWTVKLTAGGVVVDTQVTGGDGCYTWTDLGPQPGSYYDVEEVVPAGWTALTSTSHNFETPPQSGASYSFTFVNTPLSYFDVRFFDLTGYTNVDIDCGTTPGTPFYDESASPEETFTSDSLTIGVYTCTITITDP